MDGHFKKECIHGVIVGQCKCFHPAKTTIIVDCPDSCNESNEDDQIFNVKSFSNKIDDVQS